MIFSFIDPGSQVNAQLHVALELFFLDSRFQKLVELDNATQENKNSVVNCFITSLFGKCYSVLSTHNITSRLVCTQLPVSQSLTILFSWSSQICFTRATTQQKSIRTNSKNYISNGHQKKFHKLLDMIYMYLHTFVEYCIP